jgi:hypothetical protein
MVRFSKVAITPAQDPDRDHALVRQDKQDTTIWTVDARVTSA